jgi:hypothetical protein
LLKPAVAAAKNLVKGLKSKVKKDNENIKEFIAFLKYSTII